MKPLSWLEALSGILFGAVAIFISTYGPRFGLDFVGEFFPRTVIFVMFFYSGTLFPGIFRRNRNK